MHTAWAPSSGGSWHGAGSAGFSCFKCWTAVHLGEQRQGLSAGFAPGAESMGCTMRACASPCKRALVQQFLHICAPSACLKMKCFRSMYSRHWYFVQGPGGLFGGCWGPPDPHLTHPPFLPLKYGVYAIIHKFTRIYIHMQTGSPKVAFGPSL